MSVDYTEMDIIGLEMQDNAKKKEIPSYQQPQTIRRKINFKR